MNKRELIERIGKWKQSEDPKMHDNEPVYISRAEGYNQAIDDVLSLLRREL